MTMCFALAWQGFRELFVHHSQYNSMMYACVQSSRGACPAKALPKGAFSGCSSTYIAPRMAAWAPGPL